MKADAPNFCPSCGTHNFSAISVKEYHCSDCGYRFFQNTASAVAAMIVVGRQVLLAERGREPAKGLYDFPGGFVDPDENLETALLRELSEELALKPSLSQLQYAFSDFNTYEYASVVYKTVDVFFLAKLDMKPKLHVSDDVAAVKWFDINEIDPDELAFDGMRRAIIKLKAILNRT